MGHHRTGWRPPSESDTGLRCVSLQGGEHTPDRVVGYLPGHRDDLGVRDFPLVLLKHFRVAVFDGQATGDGFVSELAELLAPDDKQRALIRSKLPPARFNQQVSTVEHNEPRA